MPGLRSGRSQAPRESVGPGILNLGALATWRALGAEGWLVGLRMSGEIASTFLNASTCHGWAASCPQTLGCAGYAWTFLMRDGGTSSPCACLSGLFRKDPGACPRLATWGSLSRA